MTALTDRTFAALLATDGDVLAAYTEDAASHLQMTTARNVLHLLDLAATAEGVAEEVRERIVNRAMFGHPDPHAAHVAGEVTRQVARLDDVDGPDHPAVQALHGIGRHLDRQAARTVMPGEGAGSPVEAAHTELRAKVTAALGLDPGSPVGDIIAAARVLSMTGHSLARLREQLGGVLAAPGRPVSSDTDLVDRVRVLTSSQTASDARAWDLIVEAIEALGLGDDWDGDEADVSLYSQFIEHLADWARYGHGGTLPPRGCTPAPRHSDHIDGPAAEAAGV